MREKLRNCASRYFVPLSDISTARGQYICQCQVTSLSLSLSDQEICGYHPAFLSQECERRKRDKKTGESDVMVARQRETCKAAIKAEIFGTIPCLEHWKISGSKFARGYISVVIRLFFIN